jgi:hypothetical protein
MDSQWPLIRAVPSTQVFEFENYLNECHTDDCRKTSRRQRDDPETREGVFKGFLSQYKVSGSDKALCRQGDFGP